MADRYWVGGSGSWTAASTTNWSATPGGAGGASAPTAADNVFFEAASGSNYTVSVGTVPCLNINITKPTTGTLTFTGAGTLTISGSFTAAGTGVTWSQTGPIIFNSTTAQTITSGGLAWGRGTVTFNGVGGSWALQDNWTTATTTSTATLTNGTININNNVLSPGLFSSSGAAARTIAFGTGSITLSGNAGTIWNTATTTNLTITGTPVVNANYSGATGTRTMTFGTIVEAQAPSVNITAGTDAVQVTGSVNNLNTTGFSGTFNGGLRTIYGSLTFSTTTTIQTSASATTLTGTSGTNTITTNGRTIDFPLTINGQGSTWQLQDSYTGGATATSVVTLSGGTLDLNGQAFTAFRFSGTGAGTRSLIATGSTFTLFGNAATILDFSTIGGLTLTGLATVTFTYAGATGTRTITSNSFTEAVVFDIIITGGTDIVVLGGSIQDLDFTGFSGTLSAGARILYGNLTLGTGMTVTSGATATGFSNTSGTTTIDTKGVAFPQQMTFAGVGGTRRLLSNVNLDVRNISFTGGNLDLNDFTMTAFAMNGTGSSARQLQFGTSGVIDLTANGTAPWNCATVTGFSYTGNARVNLTYAGATSIRTISHGSTGGGSDATKAPPLYIASGATDSIAASANSYWSDLIFADGANVILTNTNKFIFGNLTFSPGMNLTAGSSSILFAGNGVQTFDSANLSLDFPIIIGTGISTGNLQLANTTTLGSTRALTLSSGNLVANGFNITAGSFSSTNSNPRILDISNVTVSIASTGTVWNMATSANATVIATNSNILLTNTTTTARTFAGGSLTYGNLDIGGATGTSTLTVTGNNTFAGALTSSKTVAHTIAFTAGTTTTVGAFTVTGTAGNVVTIASTTAAQHNLVLTTGNVTTVDYLNIAYSNASPSTDTWYPGLNSVNLGNNNGWMFPAPVGGSSNFFLVF